MDFSKKTVGRQGFKRQSLGMWTDRSHMPQPFGWHLVDRLAMVAAFSVCCDKGTTLSIAPGNGGVGVTVRLYQGDAGDYAYADTPESLNELFEVLIAKWGSSSEDVKMSIEGLHLRGPQPMPAD